MHVYGRDGVEVHKLAKKERDQYPAILTEQAWSIKDLLYGFRGNFSCGTRRVVPKEQHSSRAEFDSSGLLDRGASHVIDKFIFSLIGRSGQGNILLSVIMYLPKTGMTVQNI